MANNRPVRSNAGNRMTKLIEEQADEEDDFYKTTYGGFNEEEDDGDYEAEEIEEDVVDSDFSLSEEEEEAADSGEDEKRRRQKSKKIKTFGQAKSSSAIHKPRKPTIKKIILPASPPDKRERMRATTLLKAEQLSKRNHEAIRRHPKQPQLRRLTQQELLAEACITEEQNLASLAQFLKLEAEKKTNKMTKVRYNGPIIRYQSLRMPLLSEGVNCSENIEFCSRNFLEFTDTQNFPREYFPSNKLKHPTKPVCVVTGRPAKYKDPLTGLPYATIEAFKYIRQHRRRLKEEVTAKNDIKKRKRSSNSVIIP